MRRTLLALAVLLVAAGCEGDPAEPDRTEALTGTLARSGTATAPLSMRSTGNLRVTAVDLESVAADGATGPAIGGITFSVGNGTTAACVPSGSFGLIEGSVVSLGLHKGDHCIRLSEPTVVPEGFSVRYELKLEISD